MLFESYDVPGFNYRMTDVQAAIGRQQLKRLPEMLVRRRQLASGYAKALADVPGIVVPAEPEWARSNWQSYCVRLPKGTDQKAVMSDMLERGVATRRGVMCIHREPAYAGMSNPFPLKASEAAQDECILLPMFAQMTADEQETVVSSLKAALALQSGTAAVHAKDRRRLALAQ